MDATSTPIDSTLLWIYEWICVDIGIPYMVLYGGTIWHAIEGGMKSCETDWEDFRFAKTK